MDALTSAVRRELLIRETVWLRDLSKLMELAAWDAAPRVIRNRAAAFLAGSTPVV